MNLKVIHHYAFLNQTFSLSYPIGVFLFSNHQKSKGTLITPDK